MKAKETRRAANGALLGTSILILIEVGLSAVNDVALQVSFIASALSVPMLSYSFLKSAMLNTSTNHWSRIEIIGALACIVSIISLTVHFSLIATGVFVLGLVLVIILDIFRF